MPVSRAVAQSRVANQWATFLRASPHIKYFLSCIQRRRKEWALVGGAPRIWATCGSGEPGDIDLVIGADAVIVEQLVAEWARDGSVGGTANINRNRFGGFRLFNADKTMDVWAAPESISVAKGLTSDSNMYRAVAKSAALTLDSLVFTSRGTLYDRGFFTTLRTGLLRVNHCHIEHGRSVAHKATLLCRAYGLVPDLSLQTLMSSALGSEAVATLLSEHRWSALEKTLSAPSP